MASFVDGLRLAPSLHVSNQNPTLPRQSNRPAATNNANQDYTNYNEEWIRCREATDKFDGNLFDLRKYGFSILTGLITAGSFLGFSEPTQFIQVGVIIVTMGLVVILYWLDIFYQGLLYGSVFRTRFLEFFKLNRGLSIYISALYGASNLGSILHLLYLGFLVGVFLLGLFVANFATTVSEMNESGSANNYARSKSEYEFSKIKSQLNLILTISFITALIGIALIFFLCDQKRTEVVRQISSLFKYYYNDRKDADKVLELEETLNILFDRHL